MDSSEAKPLPVQQESSVVYNSVSWPKEENPLVHQRTLVGMRLFQDQEWKTPFFEVITSKYLASRPANPSPNGQPRELSGWGRAGESKRGGQRGRLGARGIEKEPRRKSDNANMPVGQYPKI